MPEDWFISMFCLLSFIITYLVASPLPTSSSPLSLWSLCLRWPFTPNINFVHFHRTYVLSFSSPLHWLLPTALIELFLVHWHVTNSLPQKYATHNVKAEVKSYVWMKTHIASSFIKIYSVRLGCGDASLYSCVYLSVSMWTSVQLFFAENFNSAPLNLCLHSCQYHTIFIIVAL